MSHNKNVSSLGTNEITPEFSHVVQVQDLPPQGQDFDLTAQPGELKRLAKRLGVDAIDALNVQAHLEPLPNGDVRLDLALKARVRQTCVVTLKPVETEISHDFTTTYSDMPEDAWGHDEEEFEDIDADIEPADPLVDGQIDIGEAAVEQLALEIDPFPRVKGAKFDGYSTDPAGDAETPEGRPNPFAVLSQLKTRQDKPE